MKEKTLDINNDEFQKLLHIFKNYLSAEFEFKLLEAALFNLNETDNKLRFNNFSYAIRQLLDNILCDRAPNDKVIMCSWYKKPENRIVIRKQRVTYIIQGGLHEEFITENLSLDIHSKIKDFLNQIDQLSSFTHINEETFNIKIDEIEYKVIALFKSITNVMGQIDQMKEKVLDLLASTIHEILYDDIFSESIAALLELSTHHSIDSIDYESSILSIDSDSIHILVQGWINCELWWGRGEDEVVFSKYFPFECVFNAKANNPTLPKLNNESFLVDTSSWSR